jgi:hypothetical protein
MKNAVLYLTGDTLLFCYRAQPVYAIRFEVFSRGLRRKPSSGMLRLVALVRADVSEERSAFLRSVRLLLVTADVPSSAILVTPMREALRSFETPVLTRTTRRNIPENGTLHVGKDEQIGRYILSAC